MSLDTVQRQTKKLISCGFLLVSRPPKRRGQWQTFIYHLQMPIESTPPQNAARSSSDVRDQSTAIRSDFDSQNDSDHSPPLARLPRADDHSAVRPGRTQPDAGPQRQAASSPKPGRTAMRLNPSKENSIEPLGEPSYQQPRAQKTPGAVARRAAWQMNQAVEVVQDRIARRLGYEGWSILVELGEAELERLTRLEQYGRLDEQTLQQAVSQHIASRGHSVTR
jgi:hypothetical protein